MPIKNRFGALMFTSGFDFLDATRAFVCTVHGDVWLVDGIDDKLNHVTWQRFATGLYQPLGLKVVDDQPIVLCRDRLTRLHDLNDDGVVDDEDRSYLIQEILGTNPGDTNLDGAVDFADFLVLSSNFGTAGGWSEGNFDLAPGVAFSDFLLLSANFGTDQSVATVPEPSGVADLVFLALTMTAIRRRSW